MPHHAIVVFTGCPLAQILDPDIRGSAAWRLDLVRAEAAEFLVCTRNRRRPEFPPAPEPHRAAFLIGRTEAIVPAPQQPDRWLIRISDYTECNIQNLWGKSGQILLRYPVWYTTLEDLGIDLAALPPFKPMPQPHAPTELAEAPAHLLAPPSRHWQAGVGRRHDHSHDAAAFDSILAQLDRIPDLAAAIDPLEWDDHGLPR